MMNELIRKLVEAFGPSGYEEEIASLIEKEISPYVDEIRKDVLGNLIAVKKGSAGGKKVMLAAHMDEIGVIVTHIDDNGFVRFSNVGWLFHLWLSGERVRFANGTLGIIHHEKLDDIKDLKLSKMYIDIGAKSKKEAEEKVAIGDTGVIHRPMEQLGNRIAAKSLDDRIGCAILIEAAKRYSGKNEAYFVFTVQEEVGTRGAKTAAFGIEPELGIAVDVTRTGDTPECDRMEVSLGKGAAIKVKDSNLVAHPKVKDLMANAARERGIPFQFEVLEHGGTDAGPIHLTREGVPAGVISVPCRYVHSPSEMVDLDDVESCVRLLVAVLETDLGAW